MGFSCQVGKRADEIIAEEHLGTEWYYYDHKKTDANGHADVELETRLLGMVCLVARDERRNTMAIVDIDPNKYHGKGLTIVGIDCDVAESTEEPVVSVDALDRHLSRVRESVWGGRDIPFPVAILTPKTTPFGGRVEGSTHGAFLAAYGVRPVPQLVLIDRKGTVAGRFDPSDKDQITLLERLIERD